MPRGFPRAMASDLLPGGEASLLGGLRIGTWNMSHWSKDKLMVIKDDIGVDLLAVQETHLAAHPLEHAQKLAAKWHFSLHHGRPVRPLAASDHGRSCGVGFLAAPGIDLS